MSAKAPVIAPPPQDAAYTQLAQQYQHWKTEKDWVPSPFNTWHDITTHKKGIMTRNLSSPPPKMKLRLLVGLKILIGTSTWLGGSFN